MGGGISMSPCRAEFMACVEILAFCLFVGVGRCIVGALITIVEWSARTIITPVATRVTGVGRCIVGALITIVEWSARMIITPVTTRVTVRHVIATTHLRVEASAGTSRCWRGMSRGCWGIPDGVGVEVCPMGHVQG